MINIIKDKNKMFRFFSDTFKIAAIQKAAEIVINKIFDASCTRMRLLKNLEGQLIKLLSCADNKPKTAATDTKARSHRVVDDNDLKRVGAPFGE